MSEDTEQRGEASAEASPEEKKTDSKGASAQVYRVNRLGREIFAGDKDLLVQAIQTRRVRGDDLIYDEAQELWGFARKHQVFLEATGQGLEESKRARDQKGSVSKWLRFFVNAGFIGIILYLLISYSEKIEFKLREESEELRSQSTLKSPKENLDSEQSGVGSGEGDGEGSGGGGGLDGGGGVSRQDGFKGEIKQVFDLNADGMRDASLVIESTLSDEELISKVQYIHAITTNALRDKGKVDQQSFSQLQEARAVATFVAMRNEKHQGARLLLSQINRQLHKVCALLYSEPFCELKDQHPEWKDSTILAILDREVLYGMTAPQVEAAWGRASRIRRDRGGYRYCYGSGCERSVRMTEGHVREISPSPEEQRRAREREIESARDSRERKSRRKRRPRKSRKTP